jgi:hypothetical protein
VRWGKNLSDQRMKAEFYPRVRKQDVFKEGYIAKQSGHSPFNGRIHGKQRRNRLRLREPMIRAGFKGLPTEWWHFTLKDEPYPDTFFDFPVARSSLR